MVALTAVVVRLLPDSVVELLLDATPVVWAEQLLLTVVHPRQLPQASTQLRVVVVPVVVSRSAVILRTQVEMGVQPQAGSPQCRALAVLRVAPTMAGTVSQLPMDRSTAPLALVVEHPRPQQLAEVAMVAVVLAAVVVEQP